MTNANVSKDFNHSFPYTDASILSKQNKKESCRLGIANVKDFIKGLRRRKIGRLQELFCLLSFFGHLKECLSYKIQFKKVCMLVKPILFQLKSSMKQHP